jgi:ubiquinone/menaquinone biosynthesis C-methylase UbiE
MFWLKKAAGVEPLAVAMSGVKLGDRLLVVGCGDQRLIAQLGAKAGLTGRACALDEDPARAEHAQAAAEREGVLVESLAAPWTQLPIDAASFDVVVVRDVFGAIELHRRAALAGEVLRVLRPGGRCVVVEGGARGGLGALFHGRAGSADYASSGGAPHALSAAGFKAVRELAQRDGLCFTEGVKASAAS